MTKNWSEFDRKIFPNDEPYFLNLTKIHETDKHYFTPKIYAGAVGFSPLKEKTSGTVVRRTLDVKLRFVGFNFGHVQVLRFVIVMIQSYSFGHLYLVNWIFLLKGFIKSTYYHFEEILISYLTLGNYLFLS